MLRGPSQVRGKDEAPESSPSDNSPWIDRIKRKGRSAKDAGRRYRYEVRIRVAVWGLFLGALLSHLWEQKDEPIVGEMTPLSFLGGVSVLAVAATLGYDVVYMLLMGLLSLLIARASPQ